MSTIDQSPAVTRGFSLPAASDGWQLHLRPLGFLSGPAAALAVAQGTACRLAGGAAAFTACEAILRAGEAIERGVFDLNTLEHWARGQGERAVALVEARLAALSGARPPFAGRDFARPLVMGVINVTPDSFSDGGDFADPMQAVAHGEALLAAGADILDIGGESTRPGAAPVGLEAERARVIPVVRALAAQGAVVSVDTRHAAVMAAAIEAGAAIVNDVTALTGDARSLEVVAASGAAVVLMHMQGEPQTMQVAPRYRDAPLDVYDYLAERVAACVAGGIGRARIAVDPGIGFGKNDDHNLSILASLGLYHGIGCPVLLGVSRKGFIGRLAGGAPAKARFPGSLAAALAGIGQGVQILRVHDVAETFQALAVWNAIAGFGPDTNPGTDTGTGTAG